MSIKDNLSEYERLLRQYADLGLLHADLRASEESNLEFPVADKELPERARRRGELLNRLRLEGQFNTD